MPPLHYDPAPNGYTTTKTYTFRWNNQHGTHGAVLAINWRLKIGTAQNGSDKYLGPAFPDPGTNSVSHTVTNALPADNNWYWATPEYQTQTNGPWYLGTSTKFQSRP